MSAVLPISRARRKPSCSACWAASREPLTKWVPPRFPNTVAIWTRSSACASSKAEDRLWPALRYCPGPDRRAPAASAPHSEHAADRLEHSVARRPASYALPLRMHRVARRSTPAPWTSLPPARALLVPRWPGEGACNKTMEHTKRESSYENKPRHVLSPHAMVELREVVSPRCAPSRFQASVAYFVARKCCARRHSSGEMGMSTRFTPNVAPNP